eukprot:TRINITY_DN5193_c0_g2_i1.p2 TRINITY_DN5193_c0_g2~~TRINITY_DN5193_c0_g2_i1.p2  ORF type:complete len:253 (+),score=70.58 TRINITY_DN5193_c0_g2_i1:67-825(+)
MLRRCGALGFRATAPALHWDKDGLYGSSPNPAKTASSRQQRNTQQENWFHRTRMGEQMVPYHNQYGHRRIHFGGEMWRIVDARGMEIEALAEMMINVIMGRHRPDMKRGQRMGDHIIVVNARHITMDDNEGTPLPWRMKPYAYKTGYAKAWGVQVRRADEEYTRDPCRPLWMAILERLPRRNPFERHKPAGAMLRRYYMEKVHLFADEEHCWKEKNPIPLVFPMETLGSEQYHDVHTLNPIPRRKKPQGWRG